MLISLTLDLDQSFGHKSCATLKTLQLLNTNSNGWTGSLASLGCYHLNVLHIGSPSRVSGNFHDVNLADLRSLGVAEEAVTGTLDDLASAHKLHHLDLTSNALTGKTSSLAHLADLNHLTLNASEAIRLVAAVTSVVWAPDPRGWCMLKLRELSWEHLRG